MSLGLKIMGNTLVETVVRMESGEVISLFDPNGLVVACRKGRVWITHSPYSQDMWLVAGRTTRMEGQGHVVIEAVADSTLCLSFPSTAPLHNRSMFGFLVRPLLNLLRHQREIDVRSSCSSQDRRSLRAYFARSGLKISMDLPCVASAICRTDAGAVMENDPLPCSKRK